MSGCHARGQGQSFSLGRNSIKYHIVNRMTFFVVLARTLLKLEALLMMAGQERNFEELNCVDEA